MTQAVTRPSIDKASPKPTPLLQISLTPRQSLQLLNHIQLPFFFPRVTQYVFHLSARYLAGT
jgi:hypothetical protein